MQNLHKYYELEISYSYNTSLTNNYDCDPISFLQWAFGVTCWEVFSGGKVPYPAVDPVSLVGMLQSGYRADKPNSAACTDAMYVPLKKSKVYLTSGFIFFTYTTNRNGCITKLYESH